MRDLIIILVIGKRRYERPQLRQGEGTVKDFMVETETT